MQLKLKHLVLTTALAGALAGCGKPEHRFESTCQLIRKDVVEEDDKGVTQIVDVELEWDPCPGDQFQVVRGGAEFAKCMEQYELGKMLPVLVKHWWDNRGYYVWDVYQVGQCKREIEPESEGSYEKSQECNDVKMYGHGTGFTCSRRPFNGLVHTCPWMSRN